MPENVGDRPTKVHEYLFLLSKAPRYFYDAEAIREPAVTADPKHPNYRANGKCAKHTKDVDGAPGQTPQTGFAQIESYHPASRNRRTVWEVATRPFPGAHFATFPPKLVEPCILAGSSPKACPTCGAPWARQTDKLPTEWGAGVDPNRRSRASGMVTPLPNNTQTRTGYALKVTTAVTTGWTPTCSCDGNDGSGRCVVLDPFWGSGTTGQVAIELGRAVIGCELNPDYIALSLRTRLAGLQPTLFGQV